VNLCSAQMIYELEIKNRAMKDLESLSSEERQRVRCKD
jgi:hypothetical protein